MRSIKNKFRVSRSGASGDTKRSQVLLKTSDQEYEEKKRSAPLATQEQLIEFLRSHDGEPDGAFREAVRESRERFAVYLEELEKTLIDPGYADLFYASTGMRLCISAGHEKAWATQIARTLLSDSVTL